MLEIIELPELNITIALEEGFGPSPEKPISNESDIKTEMDILESAYYSIEQNVIYY